MNCNYRVYLKNFDGSYVKGVPCNDIDEVEQVIECSKEYFEYLIIKHNIDTNSDEVFERGQILHDVNKKRLAKKR